MLVRLDNVRFEFVFNTDKIHHIEVQESVPEEFIMYLDDSTQRVLSQEQYNKLLDVLYTENDMREI